MHCASYAMQLKTILFLNQTITKKHLETVCEIMRTRVAGACILRGHARLLVMYFASQLSLRTEPQIVYVGHFAPPLCTLHLVASLAGPKSTEALYFCSRLTQIQVGARM